MVETHLPPFPIPVDKWHDIAEQLKLSPTQKDVVELILLNQCNKQIEAALDMRHGTLRTQLDRIFQKAHVADRQELIVLLCALSHGIVRLKADSPKAVSGARTGTL